MKITDKSKPFGNINDLSLKATKLNLVREVEGMGYVKLAETDPETMYKQLARKFLKLSFDEMWKSDVLVTLQTGYPALCSFIKRTQLSAKRGKNINNRTLPACGADLATLIGGALNDKLIDEKERELYLDVLKNTDLQNVFDSVECDILLRVDGFDYAKFKSTAPTTLSYIERFYPNWYKNILAPEINKFK